MQRNLSFGSDVLSGRKARRYSIQLPVVVTSETQAAAIEATVRDISSEGVFMYLPKDAAAGPEIDFAIALPEQLTHCEGVRVQCKGTVIRVERGLEDETVGVAARITHFKFTGSKGSEA